MSNFVEEKPLGPFVRERRVAIGLEIRDLAECTGLTSSLLIRIEQSELQRPTNATLDALEQALQLEPNRLLTILSQRFESVEMDSTHAPTNRHILKTMKKPKWNSTRRSRLAELQNKESRTFHEELNFHRLSKVLTLKWLGIKIGVSAEMIRGYESKGQVPARSKVAKLERVLQLRPGDLENRIDRWVDLSKFSRNEADGPHVEFANEFRELRIQQSLTLDALSLATKISITHLYQFNNGRKLPTLDEMNKLKPLLKRWPKSWQKSRHYLGRRKVSKFTVDRDARFRQFAEEFNDLREKQGLSVNRLASIANIANYRMYSFSHGRRLPTTDEKHKLEPLLQGWPTNWELSPVRVGRSVKRKDSI